MSYLDQLNDKQREAVLTQEGPLLVIAGAGAGKTRTVAYRILHLIKTGAKPDQILAITFTNKASKELRDRVAKLLEKENIAYDYRSLSDLGATFHSFGVSVLRRHGEAIGVDKRFSIFDRDESISKIREATRLMDLDDKRFEPKKSLALISRAKGEGKNQRDFLLESDKAKNPYQKIIAQVWGRYEEILKKNKALDFDDLLLKTVELLKSQADVLSFYQNKFHYIHIDEYQDTNAIQYELSLLLAQKNKNICVVGDMDQSIYSWRGADFTNLLRFEKDYPTAKIVLLEENYRSTQNILSAANQIIAKNKQRHEKNLFTSNEAGAQIGLYASLDEGDEAKFIAQKAKELIESGETPSEIAILYRANFQSRIIEESCLQLGVPYQVLGTRFFDRKEIKDIVAFIRSARNPEDWESKKRIINIPARGIGAVTLLKWANGQLDALPAKMQLKINSFEKLLSEINDFAENNKPAEVIKYILEKTGLKETLGEMGEEGQERLENIKEFVSVATKYESLPQEEALETMLSEIALATDQDELNQNKPGIKLMTVHSAKGLEFNYVFIAGLEQDLFPHSPMGGEKRDEEEERRLFYVAVTRARRKLYLSYAQTRLVFGQRRVNMPSEFIFDIDDELVETENGIWTIL